MGVTEVRQWLERRRRQGLVLGMLGCAGLTVAGLAVSWITFWIAYGIVWWGTHGWLPLPHLARIAVALGVLAALFIGNARVDREYLEQYSFTTSDANNRVTVYGWPGAGLASNINPLALDSLHSLVKMITNVMLSGPRLITAAFRLFRKTRRLGKLDVEASAWVLTALLQKPGRIAFAELSEWIRGRDAGAVFSALRDFEGVVFLRAEPAGLSLTPELRAEIRGAIPESGDGQASW